jgi:membrane protease YdiL (CAAX protease family)
MRANKLTVALLIYLTVAYSKRYWLGDLDAFAFWLSDFICFVVIPVALVIWLSAEFNNFPEFQSKNKDMFNTSYGTIAYQTVICVLVLIAAYPIGVFLGKKIILSSYFVLERTLDYDLKLPANLSYKFVIAFYFAITAGVVEEFFFRGLIRKILAYYFSKSNLLFVIVSSIIFAGAHWAGGGLSVITTIFAGFPLAMIYVWTNDLRPLMMGHFIFDFFYYLR